MRGEGGQKMSVFVHAQGIKTVHAGEGGGVKKGVNSVTVVVECSLTGSLWSIDYPKSSTFSKEILKNSHHF